jgi:hypothetical protein
MKLKYETGIATLIQFLTLEILAIPIVFIEIYSACHGQGTQCSTNVFLSPVVFLLKAVLYGLLALLGYWAQQRRNHRLAWLLILGEFCLIPFSLFNLMHDTDYLTKATSILGLLFAIWIAVLAFRLARAKGGRIVKSADRRPRQRKRPS